MQARTVLLTKRESIRSCDEPRDCLRATTLQHTSDTTLEQDFRSNDDMTTNLTIEDERTSKEQKITQQAANRTKRQDKHGSQDIHPKATITRRTAGVRP